VTTTAGALATLGLIIFTAVYNRVTKPVNTALTATALADQVPDDARQLQARWDSVINARVALQTPSPHCRAAAADPHSAGVIRGSLGISATAVDSRLLVCRHSGKLDLTAPLREERCRRRRGRLRVIRRRTPDRRTPASPSSGVSRSRPPTSLLRADTRLR
jgi:hypothetical protein